MALDWLHKLTGHLTLTVALCIPLIGDVRSGVANSYRGSSHTLSGNDLGEYYVTWHGRVRQGSKSSSRYVTTRQPHRYSRHYTDMRLGAYVDFYRHYPDNSDRYTRMGNRYSGDTRVCVNYEANENSTVMGIFTCPLDFEPTFFTSCCGEDYVEFCCEPMGSRSIWYWLWAVIVAILVVIGCTLAWRKELWYHIRLLVYKCTKRGSPPEKPNTRRRRRSVRPATPRAADPIPPPAYSAYPPTEHAPPYSSRNENPPEYKPEDDHVYTLSDRNCYPKTPPPPYEERLEGETAYPADSDSLNSVELPEMDQSYDPHNSDDPQPTLPEADVEANGNK